MPITVVFQIAIESSTVYGNLESWDLSFKIWVGKLEIYVVPT